MSDHAAEHDPVHSTPQGGRAEPGVERFLTVDAFDIEVTDGPTHAIVTKDHSGPLGPIGRTATEHRTAIGREIEWLRAAAGISGIVQLADYELADDDLRPDSSGPATDTAVRTVYAGSRTMRSDCPSEADTASVLADVCGTLAQLQRAGLVHGSVAPEHVIIQPDLTTLLCSPNTSEDPVPDLVGLGRCIEFATEEWGGQSDRLERWLLLARRLIDEDPTMSPERAAAALEHLAAPPSPPPRRRVASLLAVPIVGLVVLAGGLVAARPAAPAVTGPEVEVEGMVVRVGQEGAVAVTRPADDCGPAQVYLLNPETSRVWVFNGVDTGQSATALAAVPGAVELTTEALTTDEDSSCTVVRASGPAGSVVLR